jgi:hypothetical protein
MAEGEKQRSLLSNFQNIGIYGFRRTADRSLRAEERALAQDDD